MADMTTKTSFPRADNSTPMQTTVIQTYRIDDQPDWIATCLRSTEAWAKTNDWAYFFRGDDIFDLVPPAFREKFSNQKPLQIDIARLLWAREIFDTNVATERVIWLDSDVFVFDSGAIHIDPTLDFALGRQIWVQPGQDGRHRTYRQVHNAILVINRSTPVLDFLIQTVLTLAERHDGPASPQFLGPKLLTALHNIVGFPVIESVGMTSPLVLGDLATGGGPALSQMANAMDSPLGAVNLCSSYRNQTVDGIHCDDGVFEDAINTLNTRGLR
ncbi:MAG: hypothetical protein GKS03_03835 [Alphaproteobacteria bacterium]|nr:hypothetical protein [Alphaproteobacteria bacterium]